MNKYFEHPIITHKIKSIQCYPVIFLHSITDELMPVVKKKILLT